MYTASTAFLEALNDAGVSFIFANMGSDHSPIIESLAEAKAVGKTLPRLITCPNEMVALSCAHGYAQVSGRAQAVMVHVDCGTQALAGAVHNSARCRIPVLIFAGTAPFTQEGELRGSRNEFIHWHQDVSDQMGIVRGYTKYNYEIRTGRNIKQIIFRALQQAYSDPPGPVYLMAAREVMEEEIPRLDVDSSGWQQLGPTALPSFAIVQIAKDLASARRPVVVTSYLGRKKEAVEELVRLSGRLGVGVLESVPTYMNFPSDNPLYLGNQNLDRLPKQAFDEADLLLVLDCDVPWVPLVGQKPSKRRIYHIDLDPLKEKIPLWYIPHAQPFRADTNTALQQLNEYIAKTEINETVVEDRRAHFAALSQEYRMELLRREQRQGEFITPEFLTSQIREHVRDDTILINEGVTNSTAINNHLVCRLPGSRMSSGGSALGWSGGAAIGAKLAFPEREVVVLSGDGSFLFGMPSAVHWMSRQYKAPFLHVIYNNRGWKAVKLSTLLLHPTGYGSRDTDIGTSIDPPPDYSGIAAAAGGAFGASVRTREELDKAIVQGLRAIREEQRSAVVDVWLPKA